MLFSLLDSELLIDLLKERWEFWAISILEAVTPHLAP